MPDSYQQKERILFDTLDGLITNALHLMIVEIVKEYTLNLYECLKHLLKHRSIKAVICI